MENTWLVQRLEKPFVWKVAGKAVDNPFSFGGGFRNGGLSDRAMELLRPIFAFDYMGSAEFEFGAVPKALQTMANDAKDFREYTITLKDSQVYESKWDKSDARGPFIVYLLCREAHKDGAIKFIRDAAKEKANLKEGTYLYRALRPDKKYPTTVCGWLELDNGFFFFTDKDMFAQTASLFCGTKTEAK